MLADDARSAGSGICWAGETFDEVHLRRVEGCLDRTRLGAEPRRTHTMSNVLSSFLISFGVIFVAELGDKSQLMALTFATRLPDDAGAHRHHPGDGAGARGVGGGRRSAAAQRSDDSRSRSSPRWRSCVRAVDAARRQAERGRRAQRPSAPTARSAILTVGAVVLPRRARRQDDAGHDHAGHPRGCVRDLARLDAGHGRGRRAGDRGRPAARHAPARTDDPYRRRDLVLRLRGILLFEAARG